MFEDDPFQEVPVEDLPNLLNQFKNDFPRSIHAYSFLKVLVKWKCTDASFNIQILAPYGKLQFGCIFFYIIFNKRLDGSLFTWTEEGKHILAECLLNTKRINWLSYSIMFTCMPQDTWDSITPLLRETWSDEKIKFRTSLDKVFWLPLPKVKEFNVEIPPGMFIDMLEPHHADIINNLWPHKHSESLKLIADTIRMNFGIGLFTKETCELVSWGLYWFYGGIGAVQTQEKYKRRGYATVVVQELVKKMAERSIDIHLNVISGNEAGKDFFKSLGFMHAYYGLWAYSERCE